MSSERPTTHRLYEVLRTPFGRIFATRDIGDSKMHSKMYFQSRLEALIFRAGSDKPEYRDLGSGLVTNVGVTAMMNDWNWPSPSGAAVNTLKLANWVATGTGATAAAATDIQCQTLAAPTTANAVSGAQSNVSAANSQTFRQITTINYTTTLSISEWGLHSAQVLSANTGTPFTAGTATTGTVTATPYTASSTTVQGETGLIVQDTTAASPFYGVVISNTTSVLTVPGWYLVSNGTLSGVNPVNADALLLKPVMWDHKVFTAIGVNNGDSIQFTYSLLINSGG
jgi:hypothetical protein